MYPVLCGDVELFVCKNEYGERTFGAKNAAGQEYELSYPVFKALRHADGTRPLRLPEDEGGLLEELKECGLVQTSRLVKEKPYDRLIVFTFGKGIRKARPVCRLLNAALPVCAVLTFIFGLWMLYGQNDGQVWVDNYSIFLFYAMFYASVIAHELGHLIAGVAYGYPMKQAGVMLALMIFPACFYVGHGSKKNAAKHEEVQLALAGVEANLLAAGLCLIATVLWEEQSATCHCTALCNILLIIANLVPSKGVADDGEQALNALFEVESIYVEAKRWVRHPKRKQKLIRAAGLPGILCIALFRFIIFAYEWHILWNVILMFSPWVIIFL